MPFSSGKPDLLPCLYCGNDKSMYLQFITITTMEPEHSKFIPSLVATHLVPFCFYIYFGVLVFARMVKMCQYVDENWANLFSPPRMS